MANRPQRAPEQQEYRDNLANKLLQLRSMGDQGKELADTLLEREQLTPEYIESLGEGKKLGHDVAEKLINSSHGNYEYGEYVAKNLNKFEGLDHEKIAEMLIDKGYISSFIENIDNFEGLNYDLLAEKIIGKGGEFSLKMLAMYINKFKGVDNKKIAEEIIDAGYSDYVINFFKNFTGLDKEIIIKIIDAKRKYYDKYDALGSFLGKEFDRSIKLDYDVAKHIVKNGMPGLVYVNFKKFDGLTSQDFITLLLDNYEYTEVLGNFLDKFEGKLDFKIAKLLINHGYFRTLSKNIGKFNGLDKEIAEKFIEQKYIRTVLFNFDKFGLKNNAEYREMIDKMLDIKDIMDLTGWKIINDNINIVEKWLDEKLITKLIIKGESDSWTHSWDRLKSIIKKNNIKINYVDILECLIKEHYYRAEGHFIDDFDCRNNEIAKMLIAQHREKCVINNIDKIKGLDKEIAEMLIERGYVDIVIQYPEKFGLKKEK